jgi:DNA topoisomerase I
VKKSILEQDPKQAKKRPELKEEESDVDDEFVERYLEAQEIKEQERAVKAMEKENEKRAAEGLELLKEPKKKAASVSNLSIERLEKKLEDLTKRIESTKLQMIDKVCHVYVFFY